MENRIFSSLIVLIVLVVINQRAICQKSLPDLKYEGFIKSPKTVYLSQVASNIEYIQLETNEDCLIKPEARFFFVDSLIFVTNTDHILKFSNKGKFLKKIGAPGRGPGEIQSGIFDISFIPNKRLIIVQSLNSLLYYSFDGRFIKSIIVPYRGVVKILNDDRLIVWNSAAYTRFTFLLMNEKNDTLSCIPNAALNLKTPSISIMKSPPFFPEHFYLFNDRCFFKDGFNDTVYYINADKIIPAYFIDLGKFKLPETLRPETLELSKMELYEEKAHNFYFCYSLETSSNVFLTSYSYNKYVPKLIIYSKPDHVGNLLINSDNISTGLVNDWDGGSDFWPIRSINDNKVFMSINIADLQKEINNKAELKRPVKFLEKQKQLSKMMSGLDILNNPIIMIVTLK